MRPFSSHQRNWAASQAEANYATRYVGYSVSPSADSSGSPDCAHADDLLRQGRLFDDSDRVQIPPTELRNACKCDLCVNPSDRQRNYHWAEIPTDIAVASYRLDATGTHHVRWRNDLPGFDDHVSSYTRQEIRTARYTGKKHGHTIFQRPTSLWDSTDYDMESATVAYKDFMNSPQSLARLLQQLYTTGLVFVTDVPKSELSVGKIARRIGPLKTTFYGDTWDVRSVPDAKNVAYTSRNLGFHMDLLYMKEPPGLQLLHCIENTCQGGLSQFVDTYKALDVLITQHGVQIFHDLANILLPYEYSNDGFYYYDNKPIVALAGYPHKQKAFDNSNNRLLGNVRRVYWSPPFTAPHVRNAHRFARDSMSHAAQLHTGKLFADSLEAPGMAVTTKMAPGTCVIFDNLRVCHARTAFDTTSGHRWLRGAYLDHQDFHSKMVALESHMFEGFRSKRPLLQGMESQESPQTKMDEQ